MTWAIHRVSLATHDLAAARTFFGAHLGLGTATPVDDRTLAFGKGSRGLRVRRLAPALATSGKDVLSASARHFAIEVGDLNAVARRLGQSSLPVVEAPPGDFDIPAIYSVDPALNVVAFCQAASAHSDADAEIQPWEKAWSWGVHHVNLQAGNVREAAAFYVEIAGLPEGPWRAPAARGDFSIDPSMLSLLPLGTFNRGIHIVLADAGFAKRNSFAHNPTIGGHPAFFVADVKAVKARLVDARVEVSDAGVYAMAGMHQVYVLDPAGNMIEVNQFV